MKIKNVILILLVCCFSLLVFSNISFASTNTEERTEDLKIRDDIYVDNYNRSIILNTPKVNEKEKIYDFADLFTDDEEKELYNNIMNYINETNMDMVIVTIDENPKSSSMAYADDFYDYNYFGIDEEHSGILFLIDMDERMIYISTTGKAIKVYKDSYINSMLDKIYDKSPSNNPFKCAEEFIKVADKYNYKYVHGSRDTLIISALSISIIATVIVTINRLKKHKMVKVKLTGDDYLSGMVFSTKQDVLVNSYTSRTRIDHDSGGSSFGGGGGGSSSHSSSSGRSHGGGGRRF